MLFAIATWWHGGTTTCGARAGAPCTLVGIIPSQFVLKDAHEEMASDAPGCLLLDPLRDLPRPKPPDGILPMAGLGRERAGLNYQAGLALEDAFEKMACNFPAIAINNSAYDPANDAFSTTAAKG